MQNVHDKEFLAALGKRVRELRLQKGWTQEDLGFKSGNSGKQIGRIERGEYNVTSCMLYKVSQALEVHIKELFDFDL